MMKPIYIVGIAVISILVIVIVMAIVSGIARRRRLNQTAMLNQAEYIALDVLGDAQKKVGDLHNECAEFLPS